MLDEASGGGENLGSRAEILTEVDDRRAGVELREAKEVVGRATSPAEHRLVVVGGERQGRRSPIARCSAIEGHHQEFNEPLLKEIQILALVDQEVVPTGLELTPNVGMVLKEADRDDQQVSEVERVPTLEDCLIGRDEPGHRLAHRVGERGECLVVRPLRAIEEFGEVARILVKVQLADEPLHRTSAVVPIHHREAGRAATRE